MYIYTTIHGNYVYKTVFEVFNNGSNHVTNVLTEVVPYYKSSHIY